MCSLIQCLLCKKCFFNSLTYLLCDFGPVTVSLSLKPLIYKNQDNSRSHLREKDKSKYGHPKILLHTQRNLVSIITLCPHLLTQKKKLICQTGEINLLLLSIPLCLVLLVFSSSMKISSFSPPLFFFFGISAISLTSYVPHCTYHGVCAQWALRH